MKKDETELPESIFKGLVPTNNGTGYMTEQLNSYSKEFVKYASTCQGLVADIGTAYGNVAIEALKTGAKVVATDTDEKHLNILKFNAQIYHNKLQCILGALPDGYCFEKETFDAIHCSRVLHFLDGDDIEKSFYNISRWLKPNGRIFIINDTPYVKLWDSMIPSYLEAKKRGAKWPGMTPAFWDKKANSKSSKSNNFANWFDPDIFARLCSDNGFYIQQLGFMDQTGIYPEEILINGRESVGVIAIKS